MRQRIDTRDREAEVGVELVGDPQRIGLEAEAQEASVAVEGVPGVQNREMRELVRRARSFPVNLILVGKAKDEF